MVLAVWKMALSRIRSHKEYSLMLFLLVMALSLFTIMAIYLPLVSERILLDEYAKTDCPDYIAVVKDEDISPQECSAFLAEHPGVIRAESRPVIADTSLKSYWNGREGNILVMYADVSLKQGEILAPYAYMAQGLTEKGDPVEMIIGDRTLSFTVTGSHVDPLAGGNIMFTYHFLPVSQEDFDTINSYLEGSPHRQGSCTEYRIYAAPDTVIAQFQKDFKDFAYAHDTAIDDITLKKSYELMMVIPRMCSYLLVFIAVILLLAVLLALRHAFAFTLEADYKTVGILKGVGFTNHQTMSFLLLHSFLMTLAGTVTGVGLSMLVQQPVLGFFLSFAGLPSMPMVFPAVLWGVMLWLCVVILLFSWFSARRIYSVSPKQAMAQGQESVHFSHRFNLSLPKLSFLPRVLRLAVKKISMKAGQYSAIFIMAVISCYLLMSLAGLYSTVNELRSASRLFGVPEMDMFFYFDVQGNPDEEINELVEEIDAVSKIKSAYRLKIFDIQYHDEKVYIHGFDTFEGIDYPHPLAGRFPRYDNEVMITPQLQKAFAWKIGDTITLNSQNGGHRSLIITGISQKALQQGRIMTMTFNGANSLNNSVGHLIIVLENSEDIPAVMSLNLALASNVRNEIKSAADSFRAGIQGITVLVLFVVIFLIALTTILVTRIAVQREWADLAIMKTAGYSTTQLRWYFTLRFLLVSAMASAAGWVLYLACSDKMMSVALGLAGIYSYVGVNTHKGILNPVVFLCALTTLSAWMSTRGIRKLEVQNLNME